ncbi:MAG TPA: sigma-70 family RNA polymerase sigma factor [Verrucomicrobiae bacterium]|jgi:RNA polymerase sigma factor (sigma-70 family)
METSQNVIEQQGGDEELVRQSLAGDQDAFGQIVSRYQSLICALTYSATGNLGRSEDLAQQTFVTAWQQLRTLREPARLRSWLCGVARVLVKSAFRHEKREPTSGAQWMETVPDLPSAEPLPSQELIRREEEAILWRALSQIPESYREAMILYYRERQSVQRVAEELELSPDAVRQRLARGRKLLHEEVATLVEGALARSRPGESFTVSVLAALPLAAATSATAAALSGTGAKVTTAVKVASAAALGGAVIGPVLGLFGGICGAWFGIKNTRSPRERQFMVRMTFVTALYVFVFLAALFGLLFYGRGLAKSSPIFYGGMPGLLIAGYVSGLVVLILRINRRQKEIRSADGAPEELSPAASPPAGRHPGRWDMFGGLGGGAAGTLCWLIVQAALEPPAH